jgi:hypothetical protein
MNKKIAAACVIVLMTVVLFGNFAVYRASAQIPLKASLIVESAINPVAEYPSPFSVYVVILASASGGIAPYVIEVFIKHADEPWQLLAIFDTDAFKQPPVVWSTFVPHNSTEQPLYIWVRVTDSTGAQAVQGTTILLPILPPLPWGPPPS